MATEIKPIENDHPGPWHREKFAAFSAAKAAIGEPTPHMRVVDWMCRDVSDAERMWRAGCYLTGYSVLTGEGIWNEWPWERVRSEPKQMLPWLEKNWAGVHTRKPRRCVRTPRQFAESLLSYADWQHKQVPLLLQERWVDPIEEYNGWWDSATEIRYYGRYIAIRLLECFRRWGYMKANLYDIRAVGAHSPIRCLMLLSPKDVAELSTGKASVVDRIAKEVKAEAAPDQSHFIFATLLCEYRACYEDGHDYAGNQHDEELEYSLSRYAEYWKSQGLNSRLYEARAAIDPHECLGEIQGWQKRRIDVAKWMRSRGVVWADQQYDYLKSIAADQPVERIRGASQSN